MIDPRLNPVLDRIDEAILDPGLWTHALDAISDLIHAGGVALLSNANGVGVWSRVDPAAQSLFYRRFVAAESNPIQDGVLRLRQSSGREPPVVTDRDLLDRSDFTRSAYFNEFMSPNGAHSALVVDLADGNGIGALNVSRSRRGGEFAQRDVSLMSALQPHLKRSFWLGMKLAARSAGRLRLESLLLATSGALFVVGADGCVTGSNAAADRLAREPGGLAVRQRKLTAPSANLTDRLQAMIARATARDGHGGAREMAVPTPGRRRPLALTVAPVRTEAATADFGGRAALVFVTDLDARSSLRGPLLAELFDLTPAETRVALALFDGASPREIGAASGVSFFTVRAQLVSIFRKTDTTGQADLVRLLARLASHPTS